MKITTILLHSTVGAVLAFNACLAQAQLLSFNVNGTVESVNDPGNALGGQVTMGQQLSGYYSYESLTIDQDPNPEYGHYSQYTEHAVVSFAINGLSFNNIGRDTLMSSYDVAIENTANGSDSYVVVSESGYAPLPSGTLVQGLYLILTDPTATALNYDLLPLTAPTLSDYSEKYIQIYGFSLDNQFYEITVRLDSIQTADADPGDYYVTAMVNDVYDPSGALQGNIAVGELLSGSYNVDANLDDEEPASDFGKYTHPPVAGFGFELEVSGLSFTTDSSVNELRVEIQNNDYEDSYAVFSQSAQSLASGGFVDEVSLRLGSNNTGVFSSDQIPTELNLDDFGSYHDIVITGRAADGSPWHVSATLTAISYIPLTESFVAVSPADSSFIPGQYFEAGFVFPFERVPLDILVSVNGMPIGLDFFSTCNDGFLGGTGQLTLVCPSLITYLNPGNNIFSFEFHLDNGETIYESVNWELLD